MSIIEQAYKTAHEINTFREMVATFSGWEDWYIDWVRDNLLSMSEYLETLEEELKTLKLKEGMKNE